MFTAKRYKPKPLPDIADEGQRIRRTGRRRSKRATYGRDLFNTKWAPNPFSKVSASHAVAVCHNYFKTANRVATSEWSERKKKKVVIWQYIQKKNMNASVYYHQVQRCKRWNSNLNLIHHKGTYTPSTLACYFLSLNHFVLCKKTKDV